MTVAEDQTLVPELARRTFAVELTPADGRNVDLRIAPYGERIVHNDGLGGVPKGVPYEEELAPGLFDHQLNAANRVLVNVEHEEGISGVVGRGAALRSAPDGFYGTVRMLQTPAGDTALELVREGVLGGCSMEAYFVKSFRTAEGVVRRVRANLRNLALCRDPAYAGAIVLGVREQELEQPFILDESSLPIPFDPELAKRIERLGLDVPSRLKSDAPGPTSTLAETSTLADPAPVDE